MISTIVSIQFSGIEYIHTVYNHPPYLTTPELSIVPKRNSIMPFKL